jgi:hypothetical protein
LSVPNLGWPAGTHRRVLSSLGWRFFMIGRVPESIRFGATLKVGDR